MLNKKLAHPWVRFPLVLGLVLLSAFCFLRYISWSFAYSATLGLGSYAQANQLAGRSASFFLLLFVALEVLCALEMGGAWEPPDLGSRGLRFTARYGSALAISLLATGIVVALKVALFR
jgi:hypothetical protein